MFRKTPPNSPSNNLARSVYASVRNELDEQVPGYRESTRQYADQMEFLTETQNELGLGKRQNVTQALRRLQSIVREDASTAFGRRGELAAALEPEAPDLIPLLSGHAASSWTPRGLEGAAAGAAILNNIFVRPLATAAFPITSPRFVGETIHGFGRASRKAPALESIFLTLAGPATGDQ